MALSFVLACACGEGGPVDWSTYEEDPAIVLVRSGPAADVCTGALIGPSLVLTAKHCAQAAGADSPYAADLLSVALTASADGTEDPLAIVEVRTTPGGYEMASGVDPALIGQDVAILLLAEPLSIAPLPLARTTRHLMGEEIALIGFGLDPSDLTRRRHVTAGRVTAIDSMSLTMDAPFCTGDSGAPLIQADGGIVGVASRGIGTCLDGAGVGDRVDTHPDLLGEIPDSR